jgi:hypothetical protein
MSRLIPLVDAVVTLLNDHQFSKRFTAKRRFIPVLDLQEANKLHVSVMLGPVERIWETRASVTESATVLIGVQQKLQCEDDGATILALAEEITDYIESNAETISATAQFAGSQWRVIYDPTSINTHNVFNSVLSLDFKIPIGE